MKHGMNCWNAKAENKAMPISSQAGGSELILETVKGTPEGSETRAVRITINNLLQERPAPGFQGDDIVRHSKEILRMSLNDSYNCCEEYNQIQSYGSNPDGGWMDEGDLPESDDSSYERKFSVVKYIGTTRSVTHVMSLVELAA
jgi:hypothetical protein